MKPASNSSRRDFLKNTAAATAALTIGGILPVSLQKVITISYNQMIVSGLP
jgi:anaerobic selenocysteine-containing dehydrogenase